MSIIYVLVSQCLLIYVLLFAAYCEAGFNMAVSARAAVPQSELLHLSIQPAFVDSWL